MHRAATSGPDPHPGGFLDSFFSPNFSRNEMTRSQWAIRALAVLALAFASTAATCPRPPDQCPGQPKPCPTPTPTPTPPPAGFDALLLSRQGPVIVDTAGKPFDFHGYAGCCNSEEGEPPIDWALTSEADMDRIKAAGLNVVHIRLGPYRALPDSPESLKATGGPYLELNGKADLTRWNPAFWAYVRELLRYGSSLGLRFEVDVTDGWGCKGGSGGANVPGYHPWKAENNAQGQDILVECGTGELFPGSVSEAWVRKAFSETVDFPVMYQDGNEINLVRFYKTTWSASIGLHLRDVEAIKKTKRHLFGTNAPEGCALPQVDYCTIHSEEAPTAADRQGTDKPVLNSEYNPDPAFSPEALKSRFCESKRNGTYWWYWRHGQTKAQAEATWALLRTPCVDVPVPEHRFPQGVPEEDFTRHTSKPRFADAVNQAMADLSGCAVRQASCVHGRDPWVWLLEVAGELRKRGLWAGQHVEGKTDEIAVSDSCTGEWDGDHITTFGDPAMVVWVSVPPVPCAGSSEGGEPCNANGCGCPAVGPGAYRGGWSITPNHCPAEPPPTSACLPCPPLGKIEAHNVGQARVVVDSTPKQCSDNAWGQRCSTGSGCVPGGAEDNPAQRQACEQQWGPYTWSIDGAPCLSSGACTLDGGNPLRVIAPGAEGKTIRVTGGNGVFGEVVGSHP